MVDDDRTLEMLGTAVFGVLVVVLSILLPFLCHN